MAAVGSQPTTKFLCGFPGCSFTFKTPGELAQHELYHSQRGPLECPECLSRGLMNTFKAANSLALHRSRVHGIQGTSKSSIAARQRVERRGRKRAPTAISDPVFVQTVQTPTLQVLLNSPVVPATDGTVTSKLNDLILTTMQPLIDSYVAGQERLVELQSEQETILTDLQELWGVLAPVSGQVTFGVDLKPPPFIAKAYEYDQAPEPPAGEEDAGDDEFSYFYSATSKRIDEWVAARKNRFISDTVAKDLRLDRSTVNTALNRLRQEGKVRMVGKIGRSRAYVNTERAS